MVSNQEFLTYCPKKVIECPDGRGTTPPKSTSVLKWKTTSLHPSYFLKRMVLFTPPKPAEMESAISDLLRPGFVGDIVKVALRIREFVVQGGVDDPVFQRQNNGDGLHAPCGTHQVARN